MGGFESFSYSGEGVYLDLDYYDDDQSALSNTFTDKFKTPATSTTNSPPTTSALSTTTNQPEVCKLTLFSDIAISAQVEGSCCWQLFGDVDFAGSTTWLRPGETYKGTDSFGRKLFRDVSSVKRVLCYKRGGVWYS